MHKHNSKLKQFNKPFKKKSSPTKNKTTQNFRCQFTNSLKTLSKKNRENQKNQIRKYRIKLKNEKRKLEVTSEAPILCTVVPFNSYCDSNLILQLISDYIYRNFPGNVSSEVILKNHKINGVSTFSLGKRRISICFAKYGYILDSLDSIKCSDIVFASFGYNKDYLAFDEFGYKLLKSMKFQGQTNIIGIFSSKSDIYDNNSCLECEKIIKKSFEMEFNKQSKFFSLSINGIRSITSLINNIENIKLSFRDGRGYVLSEFSKIRTSDTKMSEEKELVIRGFVRGEGLSLDFPAHITGIGDFLIKEIIPLNFNGLHFKSDYEHFKTNIYENYNVNEITNKELISEIELDNSCNPHIDLTECDYIKSSVNIDSASASFLNKDLERDFNCNFNSEEELDCLDEVEKLKKKEIISDERKVDRNTICRIRFSKYRGLNSLKGSNWNPYENLPEEYSRIFEIDSFKKAAEISKHIYSENCKKESFSGKYCEITLIPACSEARRMLTNENIHEKYIILSSVLPFENKVGVMSFRVKRTLENKDLIKNKTPILLQAGFRRFYICPTFSSCSTLSSSINIEKDQILKLRSFFTYGEYFVISCYSNMIFPPCPILLFSISNDVMSTCFKNEFSYKNFNTFRNLKINDWALGWGDVLDADPYRIIVKRIILIGNLFKVRKCKGVVRFMFNNPEDVKWFKSIGLKTRSGIKGVIREPLGMHGYMKCLFSKPIQQNEIIGMPIYKRVFPKWFPTSWFEENSES